MKKVEDEVKGMLMLGEEVLLIAEQERMVPGGSLFSPNKVYVTNRRIIFRNPWLLGLKANLVDIDYRGSSNVRLKRGIFRQKFT